MKPSECVQEKPHLHESQMGLRMLTLKSSQCRTHPGPMRRESPRRLRSSQSAILHFLLSRLTNLAKPREVVPRVRVLLAWGAIWSDRSVMKAARFYDYGPPTNLVIDEVERPKPGDGEVLVEVYAAGVNPVDWKYRKGLLQQWSAIELPHIGGFDLAGTISE